MNELKIKFNIQHLKKTIAQLFFHRSPVFYRERTARYFLLLRSCRDRSQPPAIHLCPPMLAQIFVLVDLQNKRSHKIFPGSMAFLRPPD